MKSCAIYLVPLALLAGLLWLAASQPSQDPEAYADDTRTLAMSCVTHGPDASYHIHLEVDIVVNGEPVGIPKNVGIDDDCMRAIHTHAGNGEIHIEYPTPQNFTLGDFFAIWGREFDEHRILEYKADETHEVRLTVNGNRSDAYEDHVMRDGDRIVIAYEEVKQE